MTQSRDVVLASGPFDGSRLDGVEGPLLEMEADGLIHRYVATTTTRRVAEDELTVYQFDGTISPDGGMAGVENPENRVASPLADELRAEKS
ncbi:hypothetical protein [Catellatospora sichuanensis]|uniref:hypothetical protein n=1 Tax=Catellatospora sichuanensis TaxID=1969805 RepID=UPI001182852B|nr:hypothetical protein [Catellatospora sichuanensis]